MTSLLSRVLAATGPDRALARDIGEHFGTAAGHMTGEFDGCTESLDAARAVIGRMPWIAGTRITERDGSCDVLVWGEEGAGIDIMIERDDNQVALALLAAILKAKEARDG